MSVSVAEIFGPTIQGELGPDLKGFHNSNIKVFLRTSNCNFHCSKFGVPVIKDGEHLKDKHGELLFGCDSFNTTYHREFNETYERFSDFKDLVNEVDKFFPKYSKHNNVNVGLVATGGEPTVWWNDEVYQRTLAHYVSRGVPVTIETNASLDIDFTHKWQEQIQFAMSVKLSNSGEDAIKRINITNITKMVEYGNNSYLKFVMNPDNIEEEWLEIKSILNAIPTYVPCFIMALAKDKEQLEANGKRVADFCLVHGMQYIHRIHIALWDDEKLK